VQLPGQKTPDGSPAQQLTLGRHGPYRDAHRAQCLSTGHSCCYFLWKKVTKELCGIGTHASIAAPRAVGFGALGVNESESLRTPCTETYPLRLKLPSAHRRRFRGARIFCCAARWCRRSSFSSRCLQQDMPEACPYSNGVGTRLPRVQSLPDRSPAQQGLSFGAKRKSADDIATTFRTWIENSSFTPLTCGVPTPEIKLGRHGPRRHANKSAVSVLVVTFFGRK
jgi:hypothetical protein